MAKPGRDKRITQTKTLSHASRKPTTQEIHRALSNIPIGKEVAVGSQVWIKVKNGKKTGLVRVK